ncbi:HAD hydrolase family protein, partial [Streptococcus suis]
DELEINTCGGPLNILETCAKGDNKATSLSYVLNIYKATPSDLIAFGDEHNYVEMLDLAGTAYAMKNCRDTLRPHADRLTAFANFVDGVARELENLFL